MASNENGNVAKLREVGLVAEGPLPDELQSVVEGLTGDEVDILVSVKRRLDDTQIPGGFEQPERHRALWELFMTF